MRSSRLSGGGSPLLAWDGGYGRKIRRLNQVAIEWTGTYGGGSRGCSSRKNSPPLPYETGETPGTTPYPCGTSAGEGHGSSTALVIAIAQAIFGEDCRSEALFDRRYRESRTQRLGFCGDLGRHSRPLRPGTGAGTGRPASRPPARRRVIDTGQPNESTPEMVEWMKGKKKRSRVHSKRSAAVRKHSSRVKTF